MNLYRNAFCLLLLGSTCIPVFAKTWYVRRDGGTRHSTGAPKGQCDGQADAAYPGSGTNRHCAFNDYRYLYTDASYGNSAWVIAGGDTVILRGGPWRVGYNGPNSKDHFGVNPGDPYNNSNPPIPAGTASQHTRILGENFANCSKSNMTQLFGGYGLFRTIDLSNTSYVDLQCIELTRHSQCTLIEASGNCSKGYPLDDYAMNGIATSNKTHDILLQDMWIHGFLSRGIIGPIGGLVTAKNVVVAINAGAGWDFDDGGHTPSVNGRLNFSNVTIEWNGCTQAYPGGGVLDCRSQSTGGYGDGLGTTDGTCIAATVDHSTFRYNTQDGDDMLHSGTGSCPLTITNSSAYGNNGQQFKWGANLNPVVFTNNTVVGNCLRLSAPMTGVPNSYNANLQDFCRAGDTIAMTLQQGGSVTMANNTIVSYSPTIFDIGCSDPSCSNSTLTFKNNIVLGYDNPATHNLGGKPGGPGTFYYGAAIGNIVRSNNIYYGTKGMDFKTIFSNERTTNPKFVSQPAFTKEQDLDGFNFHLSPASPAQGIGASVP